MTDRRRLTNVGGAACIMQLCEWNCVRPRPVTNLSSSVSKRKAALYALLSLLSFFFPSLYFTTIDRHRRDRGDFRSVNRL